MLDVKNQQKMWKNRDTRLKQVGTQGFFTLLKIAKDTNEIFIPPEANNILSVIKRHELSLIS